LSTKLPGAPAAGLPVSCGAIPILAETRLQGLFAGGVCDWTKPGVEQQRLIGTWVTFD
jgi:hypothetical protein